MSKRRMHGTWVLYLLPPFAVVSGRDSPAGGSNVHFGEVPQDRQGR